MLLILAVFSYVIHAQEFTVFYKENKKAKYHQLVSSARHGSTKEELAMIHDAINHGLELRKYQYESVLRIKDHKSLYYPLEKVTNDTINSHVVYGEGKHTFINRETSEKEYKIVYMDQSIGEKSSVEYAYGKEYLIEKEPLDVKWELTNERKNMYGYSCKKALLSAELGKGIVEVWYTDEVDVSIGPAGYWGLPGLIVQVIEEYAIINFDRILYSLDGFEIKPPLIGEKITRDQLEDIPMLLFNEF